VESVTYLYTYPDAMETEQGRADVTEALQKLSAELQLNHELRIKGGHGGQIVLPDVAPDEAWAAMGRVVSDWPELFLPPTD
jgi:hypothetical protein